MMEIYSHFGIRGKSMKKTILKSDLLLAKTFLRTAYPAFISELQLDMDIDYLCGLCSRFVKKEELGYQIIDLSHDQKNIILNYLKEHGTIVDKTFFELMLSVQILLHKYYNSDGTFKEYVL